MAAWETEDEYAGSLTASEATLKTTSRVKPSRRRSVTPPANRSTSPPMADKIDKASKRSSRDISTDESISILDPRRFTPTLHANLVSEILTLRRDQEDKIKLIESLETSLHSTKEEQELLQQNFATVSKESRSLKRQLSLLEGGTSSALGELARERDEAVDSSTETKKRLEAAQKKIRNQEEDSQRVHHLWAKEKDSWEDEKRTYERKIHVAESRLKTILEEVAAYQNAHANDSAQSTHAHPGQCQESDAEENHRDADAASVRTMSLTNSLRYSLVNSPGPVRGNGHSLADELNMDDDDETDGDATESVLSSPQHRRTMSRETVASRMHRRTLSMESLNRPGSAARSRLFANPAVLDILEGEGEEEEDTVLTVQPPTYKDTGIQYSPPPSPQLSPVLDSQDPDSSRTKTPETERLSNEVEANQRKKRVQIGKPIIVEDTSPEPPMVSASSQTMEEPLSPPWTPKLPSDPVTPPPEEADRPEMASSATQTEEAHQEARIEAAYPPIPTTFPLSIPSINVHPPTSRPTTPRSPRLPPHFKHFGCQVNISSDIPTSDASVQTEGIQVDKRLAQLPEHLRPSAISSRPTSPARYNEELNEDFTPLPGNLPPRNPRRLAGSRNSDDMPSSPLGGDDDFINNDNGPLSALQGSAMKRPQRISSLFAGFDSASSDEAEEFQEAEASDSEYRTALSAPRPLLTTKRTSKRDSFGIATVLPEQSVSKRGTKGSVKPLGADMYTPFISGKETAVFHSRKPSRTYEKAPVAPPSVAGSSRSGDFRKAAMIQGSIASQHTRSRSPSLPDGQNPPFPIPTRDSSKRIPPYMRTSSEGQRSPTRADGWHRRGSSRGSYYGSNVRRVRSATALPRNYRYRRHGSRSPPPLSVSTEAPESPGLPPLPRNDITTPRGREQATYRRHRHELSTNTENTANTDPMSLSQGSAQTTGVVDAIAQTMVGEWMYKYVRRRKSFSVPDTTGKDDTGNDRHKRWVWLAPYERSILWSSKQPSSGSALMGKTGRKLTIQSVLDVKDDNPVPKGTNTIFNRSILILTPQRALKFTATSSERHYLWLTALSFLAHSSQAVPEIIAAPQPQVKKQQHQALPEFDAPPAKTRRPGIRDSIRLAKGKSAANKIGPPSVPSIPSAPSSRMGDVASYRMAPSTGTGSVGHNREDSREAAVPPMIPRFSERTGHAQAQAQASALVQSQTQPQGQAQMHARKRSNTGSHVPPPLSFRGFSGPVGSPSLNEGTSTTTGTPASSDMQQSQASSNTTWGGSQRTSEASSRPSNFFDAIGTVRMEAFISPLAFSQMNENAPEEEYRRAVRRRSKEIRRRNSRSRTRDGYSNRRGSRGFDDFFGGNRTAGEEEYLRDDPFKGF